jgi:hypothetical protein
MGEWADLAFNASNFTASAGGTWTVASGNVQSLCYTLIGKTALILVSLAATTFTGSASNLYILNFPFTFASNQTGAPFNYYLSGTGTGHGLVQPAQANTYLNLTRDVGGTAWPASTVYLTINLVARLA